MRAPRLLTLLCSLSAACSSESTSTRTATDAAAEAATDSAGTETADASETGAEAAPSDTCVIKRAAKTSECAEACDARLFLPGGDAYCTVTCTSAAECAMLDPSLTCSAGTGTCMPKCTMDGSCTTAGFKRCDPDAGACDTI